MTDAEFEAYLRKVNRDAEPFVPLINCVPNTLYILPVLAHANTPRPVAEADKGCVWFTRHGLVTT